MKRVCHFTSVHKRYDSRIFYKQCRSLSTKYDTYLVVADGLGREVRDNVKIEDVGIRNSNRLLRALITGWKVYQKAITLNADVFEFHDPELIPYGLLLRIRGKKVIFDMHEDMEYQLSVRPWVPNLLRLPILKAYSLFEKSILKYFNVVFVPQDFMFKKYRSYFRTVLINNYLIDSYYPNIRPKEKVSKLLYVGSISRSRGIIDLMNAVQNINVTLTLVGSFSDKTLELEVRSHSAWSKVNYTGHISLEEVRELYFADYIGLIPFRNEGQYGYPYVIKLFEYMAFGLPIIMPKHGEWVNFNNDANVGLNVSTDDPQEFSNAIDKLLKQNIYTFSANGRTQVKNKFLWSFVEKELLRNYDELCKD